MYNPAPDTINNPQKVRHVSSCGVNAVGEHRVSVTEIHLVVVTRGHLPHLAETEAPLQNEAVTERDPLQVRMPRHLYWISLKSPRQRCRKVVLIENLTQPIAIRDLLDRGSRVLGGPLDQVKWQQMANRAWSSVTLQMKFMYLSRWYLTPSMLCLYKIITSPSLNFSVVCPK